MEQEDGSINVFGKGTPQGGVISPLIANLYLHECFDKWMLETNQSNPFERYADDMVVHCMNKEAAEKLFESIRTRMTLYGLELHPEKAKIVYCKDYRRDKEHDNRSFTFLGFDFQPRMRKSHRGGRFLCFLPAISKAGKKKIRKEMQTALLIKDTEQTIEDIAGKLNSKLRGWINYYGKYEKWETYEVLWYLNKRLVKWVKNKYRLTGLNDGVKKYRELKLATPKLFYHWRLGIN